MKPVQYFTDEYLEKCSEMKPTQVLQFLDDFRKLHFYSDQQKTKLISIKIPEDLLRAFRAKSELNGTKYQTQIKKLMEEWIKS